MFPYKTAFLETMDEQTQTAAEAPDYDYDYVESTARIAVYDDLLSSPQIIDIEPNTTREFINELATSIYNSAKTAGGTIPYSIILQVAENFIHSRFQEMVVSVLDGGNTIRFSDQGPGIPDKAKAQQPGYSSATAQMKRYINGVGSGLPIVREYMETKHGTVRIEDNMNSGAVVTISLKPAEGEGASAEAAQSQTGYPEAVSSMQGVPAAQKEGMPTFGYQPADFPMMAGGSYPTATGWPQGSYPQMQTADPAQGKPFANPGIMPQQATPGFNMPATTFGTPTPAGDPLEVAMSMLSQRALQIVKLFVYEDIWGVKDISEETDIPTSSTYSELKKLEEAGMMTRLGKKYKLTELGERVAQNLS